MDDSSTKSLRCDGAHAVDNTPDAGGGVATQTPHMRCDCAHAVCNSPDAGGGVATQVFPGTILSGLEISQGNYLEHWHLDHAVYHVCFRLADSVPQEKLKEWQAEKLHFENMQRQGIVLSDDVVQRMKYLYSENVEKYLDSGYGECILADQGIDRIIRETLWHDALRCVGAHAVDDTGTPDAGGGGATHTPHMRCDGAHAVGSSGVATLAKYRLHAYGIMTNHVHVIAEALGDNRIGDIVQVWKSVSSHRINRCLGRSGSVWQRDHYNHIIRTAKEYAYQMNYVFNNNAVCSWKRDGIPDAEGGVATQTPHMRCDGAHAVDDTGTPDAGSGVATPEEHP